MNRQDLVFEQPRDLFAAGPAELERGARDQVRLLVTTQEGTVHARFEDLPRFLSAGDLLVANESATLAASLVAGGASGTFTLNLSTRYAERLWLAEPRWDPARPGPMPIHAGEDASLGDATVTFVAPYPGIPRLWFIHADRPLEPILEREGVPIHYGYVPKVWPLDAYRSLFSRIPGSAEMPSAARPITPRVQRALAAAGVRFASILLHAGVSSLEIEADAVEQQAVYPEPFEVSEETARLVNETREAGHRVVAIGTTVVRALESAWTRDGMRPRRGFTRVFVHPGNPVRAVDGLLTGFHDPVTSHLAMLAGFIGLPRVMETYREAIANGYRWHEFGDSHLILRK
ncbi:MAG TPA: S-adenosylmethionine:tRNA ribosyltransferase-isomerase [Thermoplasmata archaeon]|nr:S-adenosylmethionine:tRNA ribosyltransferase-isomerase [Thermoplasmata archaeon]